MPPLLASETLLAVSVVGLLSVLFALRVMATWIGFEIKVHDLVVEARQLRVNERKRLSALQSRVAEPPPAEREMADAA